MVSRELEKECVVVFDEAHNIDNVCIEVRCPRRNHLRHYRVGIGLVDAIPVACLLYAWHLRRQPPAFAEENCQ